MGRGLGKLLLRCGSDAQRRTIGEYALRHVSPEHRRTAVLGLLLGDGTRGLRVERDGLLWDLDVRDVIGQQMFVDGRYEGREVDALVEWLATRRGADGVVVDVGANLGTTTLFFAAAGYRVVAIEPVPATFKLLVDNVSSNGFGERVICVQRAVAEGATVEMWTAPGTAQSEVRVAGRDPGFAQWGATPDGTIDVPAEGLSDTLSGVCVAASDAALVWCDVQGCETIVIRTGAALWRAGVPLYLEVWPAGLALHGGVDAFVAEVERHFSCFLERDALLQPSRMTPRPISMFGDFVERPQDTYYTDALLLP
jgi:FkbM family methyltransferase